MSKVPGKPEVQEEAQLFRIRMTLTSTNVKNLEQASRDLVEKAKSLHIKVRGPVRMPVKTLRITTRKTPNGEGTKTWDRYEMRVYKRILDCLSPYESMKNITAITIHPSVKIDVVAMDAMSGA